MTPLVVCDSGLGGLDVAAHFFAPNAGEKQWDVIYVNAYPSREWGYNDLPTAKAQEELFQSVLEDMRRFSPAHCLIACNTLSIIWKRLSEHYEPPFPVTGIIETAVAQMKGYLQNNPLFELLILGTKSTIESGIYPQMLIEQGIAAERLHCLACPKLATLIEQGPAAPEVAARIQIIAEQAAGMFTSKPTRLALAFCCTHYGYATPFWREAFRQHFGDIDIVNPNDALSLPGSATSFRYVTMTEMTPSQKHAMTEWFQESAPAIARELH